VWGGKIYFFWVIIEEKAESIYWGIKCEIEGKNDSLLLLLHLRNFEIEYCATYLLSRAGFGTIYAALFAPMSVASLDLAREFFEWNLALVCLIYSTASSMYSCFPSSKDIPCIPASADPKAVLNCWNFYLLLIKAVFYDFMGTTNIFMVHWIKQKGKFPF
jgi:hypothetical protein